MPHGQDRLIGILLPDEVQELPGTGLQSVKRLDVVGPNFIFQVGNKPSGKTSPIAFAQQGCLHHLHIVGFGNDTAGIYRTLQVTADEGIETFPA